MSERFVLCRPEGGLNDMLVQIERCCRYGEQFGRTVVVQTDSSRSMFFRDRFDRYFRSTQPRLVLDAASYADRFQAMAMQPAHLAGGLDDYVVDYDAERGAEIDSERRLPITFDFTRDHDVPLLLHHQAGGGRFAPFVLLRMTLRRPLVAELERRMAAIGGSYVAIHVRHTDLRSDYRPALAALAQRRDPRLFLATDNAAVRNEFRATLGPARVFSFAALAGTPGVPLHVRPPSGDAAFATNADAILDVLMLALSHQLVTMPVTNNPTGTFSGFSQLALDLWRTKVLLKHVLADSGLRFGLDVA